MQVCHGKAAPLRRIKPGDGVVYYSPTITFKGNDRLQAFTAIGFVRQGEPYPFDMGGGFVPYRRDIDWLTAQETRIAPLLQDLGFTRGLTNWGYPFRFGIVKIDETDFGTIARAMGVRVTD